MIKSERKSWLYFILTVILIVVFYLICFWHLSKKVKSYNWQKQTQEMTSERLSDGD